MDEHDDETDYADGAAHIDLLIMEIPIKFTEQRLIDIKDDYLGLVSDTYDEMTRNREKVDPTIAPRATITGQDDFEPVCFGAKSPRETPKFIPQFGD